MNAHEELDGNLNRRWTQIYADSAEGRSRSKTEKLYPQRKLTALFEAHCSAPGIIDLDLLNLRPSAVESLASEFSSRSFVARRAVGLAEARPFAVHF